MPAGLRALLSDIIDYAGLFPPAKLPLDTAIRNYIRYRGEPEAWMLARFICPAQRLGELDPYIREHFSANAPLRLSALGRGGDEAESFLNNLRDDLEALGRFFEIHPAVAAVQNFETKLPAEVLAGGPDTLNNFLRAEADLFASLDFPGPMCFFEIPPSEDWRAIAGEIAAMNEQVVVHDENTRLYRMRGLKLRCGGLEPAAVPSVAQVATAISACVEKKVPIKFTAGLHHPTRRIDPALGVLVHGFLNVFAAGVLGFSLGLDENDLTAIIEEEDARQFTLNEEVLAWTDAEATVNEVGFVRRRHVISFGSCSFDEPRDDLRELGYI